MSHRVAVTTVWRAGTAGAQQAGQDFARPRSDRPNILPQLGVNVSVNVTRNRQHHATNCNQPS